MVHFQQQWQATMVFDHYIQHLDLLHVQEVYEQELMYLLTVLEYTQYVEEYDRVLELQPMVS